MNRIKFTIGRLFRNSIISIVFTSSLLLFQHPLLSDSQPSEPEVRKAVENYFASDDLSSESHAQLAEWGNNALPYLKAMALDEHNDKLAWAIVVSIQEINTEEAVSLLLEIADGKTKLRRDAGYNALLSMINNDKVRQYLTSNPDFKKIVFDFAKDENWLCRSNSADIIANMGWTTESL